MDHDDLIIPTALPLAPDTYVSICLSIWTNNKKKKTPLQASTKEPTPLRVPSCAHVRCGIQLMMKTVARP
jgi:hypothetical protein